jgi:hypothetical protein
MVKLWVILFSDISRVGTLECKFERTTIGNKIIEAEIRFF